MVPFFFEFKHSPTIFINSWEFFLIAIELTFDHTFVQIPTFCFTKWKNTTCCYWFMSELDNCGLWIKIEISENSRKRGPRWVSNFFWVRSFWKLFICFDREMILTISFYWIIFILELRVFVNLKNKNESLCFEWFREEQTNSVIERFIIIFSFSERLKSNLIAES